MDWRKLRSHNKVSRAYNCIATAAHVSDYLAADRRFDLVKTVCAPVLHKARNSKGTRSKGTLRLCSGQQDEAFRTSRLCVNYLPAEQLRQIA